MLGSSIWHHHIWTFTGGSRRQHSPPLHGFSQLVALDVQAQQAKGLTLPSPGHPQAERVTAAQHNLFMHPA